MGGRSVCVPQFKGDIDLHDRKGLKYPLILEDRVWNYFIDGWLQGPEGEMLDTIEEVFGQKDSCLERKTNT